MIAEIEEKIRTTCVNGLYSKQTRANAEKEYTLAESNTAIIET